MDLPHIPQLICNLGAVTTAARIAPGHHRPICQDSSKCTEGGWDLLDVFQLILYSAVVTTTHGIAPCDHSSATSAPEGKGGGCCSHPRLSGNSCEASSIMKSCCWQQLQISMELNVEYCHSVKDWWVVYPSENIMQLKLIIPKNSDWKQSQKLQTTKAQPGLFFLAIPSPTWWGPGPPYCSQRQVFNTC